MVDIIKIGKIPGPKDPHHRCICDHCETVFEFRESESIRQIGCFVIHCPLCDARCVKARD